jgi:hypothetical protein
MGKKKTAVVPKKTKLRVRVIARSGKPVQDASVALESPAKTVTTPADGIVSFELSDAELAALTTAGQVKLSVKKRHHGPDPGAGAAVVPGLVILSASVTTTGFDPTTPRLTKDKNGDLLDVVLVDAGMNFGVQGTGVTRRLLDDEVQKELIFHHHAGTITLGPKTEFVFDHDTTNGEFDACDPTRCKIKTPLPADWVDLKAGTSVAGVSFFALLNFGVSGRRKTDQMPGQKFLRDSFDWGNMTLRNVDQRHMVGLTRMCRSLNASHGIVAIYTQGINGDSVRADCHGFGRAIDFGGASTDLPDPATKTLTVRPGVDFIVFLHWGGVPMFDGRTVLAHPTDPTQWVRLSGANDDGFDYDADRNHRTRSLHYRLDPPPFQDAVPALGADPANVALAAQLAVIAPHFVTASSFFQAVYDFAVAEYSDNNSALGKLPAGTLDTPTPIDNHDGHFILHPDYPKPNPTGLKNGRQAHVNHLHFQVGPTNYPAVRTH